MKKSSKQKNKKHHKKAQQNKQHHQHAVPSRPDEQPVAAADGTEVIVPDAEVPAEALVNAEIEVAPEVTMVAKPALAAMQQAALLAQQQKAQQSKQWNKQVKAGKMVGAHVPKRFNRGG